MSFFINDFKEDFIMKIGFIGCGNMAQAMITGILTQKVVSPQELIVSNPREEKTAKLKDEF